MIIMNGIHLKWKKVQFLKRLNNLFYLGYISKMTLIFYCYEVYVDTEGEYYTLDYLLKDSKVLENNSDIISFIKEYYNI